MSFDIDLELDGLSATQAELQRLKERWSGPVEILVFSRAEYSSILEFGRGPVEPTSAEALRFEVDGEVVYAARVSGHPPYPFFAPAFRELRANPEQFVRKHTSRGFDAYRTIEGLMDGIGSALEAQIKANATAQQATGRSPGTHPDHPKVQSGNLRRHIGYVMLGA